MKTCLSLALIAALSFALMPALTGCTSPDSVPGVSASNAALQARADSLAHAYIIVDGHIDVPYRLTAYMEDVSEATETGDFDYNRAKAGGLDAPFMSIYIPSDRQETPGAAKALADSLIDMVEGIVERAPDKFAIALSPADVREHFDQGVVSLPLGMENGAPIEEDLSELRYFYDRGIRYITLTHAKDNRISDSSYDSTRTHGGLSDFGRDVVREMNRIGMIVDVSHISDSAFYQVMETTAAPVVASHSSARAFTPGFERNMDDAMIQRLAENDGVIMINFGSSFLRGEYQEEGGTIRDSISAFMEENGLDPTSPEGIAYFSRQRKANPVGSVDDVIEHINHVVELVGVDHVGLGSDFDGVFALPDGLLDVAYYPNLVYRLLEEGYTDEDIEKILGGNALRVWEAVERVAEEQQERS